MKPQSNGNNTYDLPLSDEVEISIFGKGIGESILIHYGSGNWLAVDSSINPLDKKPFIISYLNKLDVDISTKLKLAVASHWHDDHIKGLSEVVSLNNTIEFVCPAAIKSNEFLTIVEAYRNISIANSCGIYEMINVLNHLKNNKCSPILASDDKLILRDNNIIFYSLSPSSETIINSLVELSNLIPIPFSVPRVIPSISPNDLSVTLWLQIHKLNILLGADLQNSSKLNSGWNAVLNSKSYKNKSDLFKIPHHGSSNSYNSSVWNNMLVPNVFCILTPFNRLKNPLPTKNDIRRICRNSKNTYITSLPQRKKLKRSNVVEKSIKEVTRDIRLVSPSCGHVRLRTNPRIIPITWQVDLFGKASRLCPI